ncbi:MAG: hypothetical protein HY770_06495 [Chitinivibrionia bacterium]|nr:hypothetical protein [Chitinivibrionia bacterium]
MKCLPLFSLFVLVLAAVCFAQVPATITYQGVLTDGAGAAVADGDYGITFKLYDIESGGTALWEETHSVPVSGGIFNVVLGSAGSPLELPFDRQYWLGISINAAAELSPRRPFASVPYSLNARGVDGQLNIFPPEGNAGIGTKTPSRMFLDTVDNWHLQLGGDEILRAMHGSGYVGIGNNSPVERLDIAGGIRIGMSGGTNAGTIRWTGSDFEGYDGSAWQSLTASGGGGLPAGSAGQTLRHNGSDWVSNDNLYNDGANIGIGTTNPQHTLHVNGLARFDLPSGQISVSTPGGWPGFITYSENGHRRDIVYDNDRMFLSASSSSAAPSADNGISLFESGQICIGSQIPSNKVHISDSGPTYVNIDAPSGYAPGVIYSVDGSAVWRQLYHPADGMFQFYREGIGPKMVISDGGLVGIGTSVLHGDRLEVHSPNPVPGYAAVAGFSYFTEPPTYAGGVAVAGIHSDDGVGGIGVYGEATDGGQMFDSQVGVYGYSDDGYGVYSYGTLASSSAIVSVAATRDFGHRTVYAVQSTGNWFEDFGKGRLSGGEAIVEIDPVFAQTVALSDAYHVFLTPLGDGGLYVAEKTDKHFVVRSQGSGRGDVAFDYRIVAKRKGFESKRLEAAQDPDEMRLQKSIPFRTKRNNVSQE